MRNMGRALPKFFLQRMKDGICSKLLEKKSAMAIILLCRNSQIRENGSGPFDPENLISDNSQSRLYFSANCKSLDKEIGSNNRRDDPQLQKYIQTIETGYGFLDRPH